MNFATSISSSKGQLNILFEVIDKLIGDDRVNIIFEFGSRYGEDTIEFAIKYPKAKFILLNVILRRFLYLRRIFLSILISY